MNSATSRRECSTNRSACWRNRSALRVAGIEMPGQTAHEHRPVGAGRHHPEQHPRDRPARGDEHDIRCAVRAVDPPDSGSGTGATDVGVDPARRERRRPLRRARRDGRLDEQQLALPVRRQPTRRNEPAHFRYESESASATTFIRTLARLRVDTAELGQRRQLAREHALHAVTERLLDDPDVAHQVRETLPAPGRPRGRIPTSPGRG